MIEYTPTKFKYFKPILIKELHKNKDKILNILDKNVSKYKKETNCKCNVYNMNIIINYKSTLSFFNSLIEDNKE